MSKQQGYVFYTISKDATLPTNQAAAFYQRTVASKQQIWPPEIILKVDGDPRATPAHSNASVSLLKWMWNTKEFSDFVIKAEEKEFEVHRVVLGGQSKVFANEMLENKTGTMTISGFSAEDVEEMLRFLYTGVFQQKCAVNLFSIATKYQIITLKQECEPLVIRSINDSNALKILQLADACSSTNIKTAAFNRIQKMFPQGIIRNEHFNLLPLLNKIVDAEQTRKRKIVEAEKEYEDVLKKFKKNA